MAAAEALDDLFEEHSVRHLGLTPRHLVLRNGKLLLRYFGVVEWIQLPAGQQAVALNPRYAAPEILEGTLHPTCDVYSLAVIYCELLTGTHPLGGCGAAKGPGSSPRPSRP